MNKARIANALGASQRVRLPHAPRDAADALALMEYVHEQLDAGRGLRPGRPSNPNWTFRRLVPFSAETWKALEERAEAVSTTGRRVSPAQLAAVLLDRALFGERVAGGRGLATSIEATPELPLENERVARAVTGSAVRRALVGH